MTEQEIKLIKTSWAHFRRLKPEVVADAFYSKLFLDNPSLRKLFPADMEGQHEKLMMMLNTIVARLDRPDELLTDIEALGVRHNVYGIKPQLYKKMVSNALFWTLKNGLAQDWNEDVEMAWSKCYNVLSELVIATTIK